MKKIEASYNYSLVEGKLYQKWLEMDIFKSGDLSKPPFAITLPPPNVTGKLHLGHAMNGAIQDLIARFKRMQGYDVLFMPGSDHAGIATQAKVEERLRKENISRYDLGREKFIQQVWNWKDEYLDSIHQQWSKLGLSLDYSKERFTLDEISSKAVLTTFTKMYQRGLIYRGERIINYDPYLNTALSNIEVIYKETESKLYYFKYKIEDSEEFLSVATTRPETMFGDEAIVINPNDSRYLKYKNKKVVNPVNNRLIPIIFDEYVDISFGTGVMKCTPAHDFNDFVLGQKYDLPNTKVMNLNATMNDLAGEFSGLDRFKCREEVVKKLEKLDLVIKIEKYINQVGYSERSNVIVEPTLSLQWFVKMDELAKEATNLQESENKIEFFPKRFEKTFLDWMNKIEDWCISRQIWWGHQIPVYYHKITKEMVVGNPPKDIENYDQDPDVLDTWFSSALWPYSTLGWPENTELIKRYYPTNVLVTAYDIVFFWVSRMIFKGLFDTNKKPFNDCLIHGLIRASDGRKMSKSLNNGIDPMQVIDDYGCDSLRFFLLTNSTPGLDLRYNEEKIQSARNFINKIWNAARYIQMKLPENYQYVNFNYSQINEIDRWILKKLNDTITIVTSNFEKYEFGVAGNALYNFIYDDFCSWYIELSKISIDSSDGVIYYTLINILKMLHPFIPFVTEEIFSIISNSEKTLTQFSWPEAEEIYATFDDKAINLLIKSIIAIRAFKNENKIAVNEKLDFYFYNHQKYHLEKFGDYLKRLLFANHLEFNEYEKEGINLFVEDLKIVIVKEVNAEEELLRLNKELNSVDSEIKRSTNLLSNQSFLSKASPAKIEEEKSKYHNYLLKKENILKEILKLK